MGRKEEPLVYLDTHILVWLYDGLVDKLTQNAKELINNGLVMTSPMAILEVQYLNEVGRIRVTGNDLLVSLGNTIGLELDRTDFSIIIQESLNLNWTRDPFDRIITAYSICSGANLITADKNILKNYSKAII